MQGGEEGKGDVLSPYHPPGPPAGTGYHRYGQFLFEQPSCHGLCTPPTAHACHGHGQLARSHGPASVMTCGPPQAQHPCAGHPDCATCKQFSPVAKSIAMWNYTAFIESNGLGEKLQSNYLLAEA